MSDDVSERLQEIRERTEAVTEGPWRYRRNFVANARQDMPFLLSLVEEVGEALAQMPDWRFSDWHQYLIDEHDNVDTAIKLDDLRDAALKAEEQDDD